MHSKYTVCAYVQRVVGSERAGRAQESSQDIPDARLTGEKSMIEEKWLSFLGPLGD